MSTPKFSNNNNQLQRKPSTNSNRNSSSTDTSTDLSASNNSSSAVPANVSELKRNSSNLSDRVLPSPGGSFSGKAGAGPQCGTPSSKSGSNPPAAIRRVGSSSTTDFLLSKTKDATVKKKPPATATTAPKIAPTTHVDPMAASMPRTNKASSRSVSENSSQFTRTVSGGSASSRSVTASGGSKYLSVDSTPPRYSQSPRLGAPKSPTSSTNRTPRSPTTLTIAKTPTRSPRTPTTTSAVGSARKSPLASPTASSAAKTATTSGGFSGRRSPAPKSPTSSSAAKSTPFAKDPPTTRTQTKAPAQPPARQESFSDSSDSMNLPPPPRQPGTDNRGTMAFDVAPIVMKLNEHSEGSASSSSDPTPRREENERLRAAASISLDESYVPRRKGSLNRTSPSHGGGGVSLEMEVAPVASARGERPASDSPAAIVAKLTNNNNNKTSANDDEASPTHLQHLLQQHENAHEGRPTSMVANAPDVKVSVTPGLAGILSRKTESGSTSPTTAISPSAANRKSRASVAFAAAPPLDSDDDGVDGLSRSMKQRAKNKRVSWNPSAPMALSPPQHHASSAADEGQGVTLTGTASMRAQRTASGTYRPFDENDSEMFHSDLSSDHSQDEVDILALNSKEATRQGISPLEFGTAMALRGETSIQQSARLSSFRVQNARARAFVGCRATMRLRVTYVSDEGAAMKAGMQIGDILLGTDAMTFVDGNDFLRFVEQLSAGDVVYVKVRRGDEVMRLKLVLGALPTHLTEEEKAARELFMDAVKKNQKYDIDETAYENVKSVLEENRLFDRHFRRSTEIAIAQIEEEDRNDLNPRASFNVDYNIPDDGSSTPRQVSLRLFRQIVFVFATVMQMKRPFEDTIDVVFFQVLNKRSPGANLAHLSALSSSTSRCLDEEGTRCGIHEFFAMLLNSHKPETNPLEMLSRGR
eukprot:PhM_4_TR18819/c0_g1_i1/m.88375